MPQADPLLSRIHEEFPGLLPYFDVDHRRYLMDFRSVAADESGRIRKRLNLLRSSIRSELFDGGAVTGPPVPFVEHFVFLYDYAATAGRNWPGELVDVDEFVATSIDDFGSCESVCLWQGYPRLGIDDRNQFDYYRDLFGGTERLAATVAAFHRRGVRVSLGYNPWDIGTRRGAGHAASLIELFQESRADALFLDTLASQSASVIARFRDACPYVILCPELLPPLGEIPLLREAWQQFATPSTFEVPVHRWLAPGLRLRHIDRNARRRSDALSTAFVFGSGHIVWENVFGWWNPWSTADRRLLKRTSRVLRETGDFFADPEWEPCVPLREPSLIAHRYRRGDELLFTVLNSGAAPTETVTFALPEVERLDVLDLMSGCALDPAPRPVGERRVNLRLDPGQTGALLLQAAPPGRSRRTAAEPAAGRTRMTADPEADDDSAKSRHAPVTLEHYGVRPATPTVLPGINGSVSPGALFDLTVPLEAERYVMRVRRACNEVMEGGCYGDISSPTAKQVPDMEFRLEPYRMTEVPVSNDAFREFLRSTRFVPGILSHFLDHWRKPTGSEREPAKWTPPRSQGEHPVRWVSLDDARAFSEWAGLSIPSEAQWQYAAEGIPARKWPWGDEFDHAKCNGSGPGTTAVRRYPAGASWCGCLDMCGNLWEWTESERDDGRVRYAMVRGGSFLRIVGSIWYTASGPQPCNVHEKVLLRTPAVDRAATIGFRCATTPAGITGPGYSSVERQR